MFKQFLKVIYCVGTQQRTFRVSNILNNTINYIIFLKLTLLK